MNVLRARQTCNKAGFKSISTLYDKVSRGEFPASIPLGDRAVGWLESEVDQWIAERVAQRDARLAQQRDAKNPAPKAEVSPPDDDGRSRVRRQRQRPQLADEASKATRPRRQAS